jgi:hypothetical protein
MIRLAKGAWAATFSASPDVGVLVKYHNGTWSTL